MRGLDPRIHQKMTQFRWMDCRVKPGNDETALTDAYPGIAVSTNRAQYELPTGMASSLKS